MFVHNVEYQNAVV